MIGYHKKTKKILGAVYKFCLVSARNA